MSGIRVNALGHRLQGGAPASQVFGAMGYYRRGEVKLLGLRAYDGFELHQGEPRWERFLRGLKLTLDGSPRQFVCDGDSDITRAINRLWLPGEPDSPALVSCHYHLLVPILTDLRQSRIEAADPLYVAAKHAMDDVAHWDVFEAIAHERRRELTDHTRTDRIRYQMTHFEVGDNTAIEQFFAVLKGQFRNRRRTNRLLELMLLEQRRQAKRAEYMRIVRETLLANGGRGKPSHRIDCARAATPPWADEGRAGTSCRHARRARRTIRTSPSRRGSARLRRSRRAVRRARP